MGDDIEAQSEPCPHEASVHLLGLLELLRREAREATDRLDDVIEIEHGDLSASVAETSSQGVSDRALPRGDRPHDDNELTHTNIMVTDPSRPQCRGTERRTSGVFVGPVSVRTDGSRDGFEEFVRAHEARLRTALVLTYWPDAGREAAAEALAWAWEHWDRIAVMDAPVPYLYRVGQSRTRRIRRDALGIEEGDEVVFRAGSERSSGVEAELPIGM